MTGILAKMREWTGGNRDLDPAKAYNAWAADYDDQPGNLMIDLDEQMFSGLLQQVSSSGKDVADVGCGTGRHWNKLLELGPQSLTGFDVSAGMLEQLRVKYPDAACYVVKDHLLTEIRDGSVDVLVSTLTIAHIANLVGLFAEWSRVLKPGGEILLTDYHPEALARGAKRTFRSEGKSHSIINHIYYLESVKSVARVNGLSCIRQEEKLIDDDVRAYYEAQGALDLFERFRQVPIIYGMHLKKK